MKVKNRRTGEVVTLKEFFRQWKRGMEKVTPYQQTLITQWGYIISIIGIIWGIVFSLRIGYIWMGVILIGALIVASVQFLGNYQKKNLFKQQEELYKIAILPAMEEESA